MSFYKGKTKGVFQFSDIFIGIYIGRGGGVPPLF